MGKSLAGWVQGQILCWPEPLWRKLEVRACPSSPSGTYFKLKLYHGPLPALHCSWAAATSMLSLGPSPVWPWPWPSSSASWLDRGPAPSLTRSCVWPWPLSPALIPPRTCRAAISQLPFLRLLDACNATQQLDHDHMSSHHSTPLASGQAQAQLDAAAARHRWGWGMRLLA